MDKQTYKQWMGRVGLLSIIIFTLISIYSVLLFLSVEPLMHQTPAFRPSTIYSDVFILRQGDLYSNTFLPERLRDLQISFNETKDSIQWKARSFDYPPALLSDPLFPQQRPQSDQQITINVKEDRVSSIKIGENLVPDVPLEPAPVAQLAGSQRSIQQYLKLQNIPTKLLQAIIAIEDQRFLEHRGFDLRSLVRALWANLRHRSLAQGGSTITQQLVKNLLGAHEKTIFRKLRELIIAILMEVRYSKDQILEKYLNEVYFGQIGALEVHGVSEAARYFYEKPIEKLSLAQAALMAGVIRSPAIYSPYKHPERALERKNTVLKKMAELKFITTTELQQALDEKLVLAPPTAGINKAPYFVDYVKAQVLDQLHSLMTAEDLSSAGLRIFTTLDLPLQRRADQAVKTSVHELEARYKLPTDLRLEGLLVVANPKNGFIRALLGGRSYAETTFNRALNMKRQAGSTFKPIAYLAAFLKGSDNKGTPYSETYMIEDAPWTYSWDGQTWSPRNYEKRYRGLIPLREAFVNSINIPMAKIGVDVGVDRIVKVASQLGINSPLPAVPSLSLGSVDVSALELLQVYSTFANVGERVDLTAVRAVVDSNGQQIAKYIPQVEQVFPKEVMEKMLSLLRGVVTEGTAKNLATLFPKGGYIKFSFGKTGTTSFYRDAWFAGYSQGLVAVSWVGFDQLKTPDIEDEKAFRNFQSPALLTGAGTALPVWARFFMAAKPSKFEEP